MGSIPKEANTVNLEEPIQVAIALGAEIPAIAGSYYFELSLTTYSEGSEDDFCSHFGGYVSNEAALIALSNHIILESDSMGIGPWSDFDYSVDKDDFGSGSEDAEELNVGDPKAIYLASHSYLDVIKWYFEFFSHDSYDIERKLINPAEPSLAIGSATSNEAV